MVSVGLAPAPRHHPRRHRRPAPAGQPRSGKPEKIGPTRHSVDHLLAASSASTRTRRLNPLLRWTGKGTNRRHGKCHYFTKNAMCAYGESGSPQISDSQSSPHPPIPFSRARGGSVTTESGCGTGGYCDRVRQILVVRRGEVAQWNLTPRPPLLRKGEGKAAYDRATLFIASALRQ